MPATPPARRCPGWANCRGELDIDVAATPAAIAKPRAFSRVAPRGACRSNGPFIPRTSREEHVSSVVTIEAETIVERDDVQARRAWPSQVILKDSLASDVLFASAGRRVPHPRWNFTSKWVMMRRACTSNDVHDSPKLRPSLYVVRRCPE